MEKLTIDQLIKSVPHSIRFEILKKQLNDIYDLEVGFFKSMKRRGVNFYDEYSYHRLELLESYDSPISNDCIYTKTQTFLKTIEKAELPNDMLIELYQWAKKRRNEWGLKDNLFNLFDEYIFEAYKYKELNEELNGRMVL